MSFEFPKTRQYYSIPKEAAYDSMRSLTEKEKAELGLGREESKRENKEAPANILKTKWKNPENGQDHPIEINLEEKISEFKSFYKNKLNIGLDEAKIREIWNKRYAEIKAEIEKYGYDSILIIPDNLPEEADLNRDLIETMEETIDKKKKKVAKTYQGSNFETDGGSFAGVKNSYAPKYRLVLTHGVQNIEDHPILKATRNRTVMDVTGLNEAEVNRRITNGEELPVDCEVEINGQKFKIEAEGESLEDYIIQQRMHFDKTGEHLDAKSNSYARLLKSFSSPRVVSAVWDPGGRQLVVYANDPSVRYGFLCLRLSRSFS